jgi:hypothetical protein
VLSHFGGEFRRNVDGKVVWKGPDHGESKDRPEVNYAEFLRALKQTGYDGYLAYEFCHLALDEQHRGPLGRDYVDQQAGFAAEFMRELMQEVGVYSDAMAEVR